MHVIDELTRHFGPGLVALPSFIGRNAPLSGIWMSGIAGDVTGVQVKDKKLHRVNLALA